MSATTSCANALWISGGIGFLLFALVPVAPPRLLELGLLDTVSDQSNAYRAFQPPGFTNQYAALPSLHIGWNLAVGIVVFMTTAHLAVRAFAVLSPLAMAFAVIATANHFLIDVLAGVAVVLVGLAGALMIEKRRAGAPWLHPPTIGRSSLSNVSAEGRRPFPSRARHRQRPLRPLGHGAPQSDPCGS